MIKKILYSFFISLITLATAHAQEIPPGITDAFQHGDAKKLSQYLHDNLELKIADKTYITSNNQAERILDKFFRDNPPKSFIVNFDGTRQGSKYGLGSLLTAKHSFRVNIYFLENQADKKIYFLSIEKEQP